MNIAVFGLGNAGLPLAVVIADRDFKVVGVDIDMKKCNLINKGINPITEEPELNELIKKHGGKNLVATPHYKDAINCNFYIVIVPLFIDKDHQPVFKILETVTRNIGKMLKKDDCVVLETTVPPKTTETLIKKWLEEESGLSFGDFYLANSPERIMTGYSISRLKKFPKIIGGVDAKSGKKAFKMYKNFIPNLSLVSSSRVAEFIKVIEGCYRSTNIALANELFNIAEELNIDFFEAREYANHKYCDIHMPSTGVGGHCIPVYPWFLVKEMKKQGKSDYSILQEISLKINNEMVSIWVKKIIDESKKLSKIPNEVKICIKGITFRKGVKSLYNSRNLALVKLLEEKGLDVYVYDDLFSENELKKENLRFANLEDVDLVFDTFTLEILK